MQQQALVCKSMAASDSNGDRDESPPDYKGDDDSDDNFKFGFNEDYTTPSSPCHILSLPAQPSTLVSMPGQAFLAKTHQQFDLSFILAVPIPNHYICLCGGYTTSKHPIIST